MPRLADRIGERFGGAAVTRNERFEESVADFDRHCAEVAALESALRQYVKPDMGPIHRRIGKCQVG